MRKSITLLSALAIAASTFAAPRVASSALTSTRTAPDASAVSPAVRAQACGMVNGRGMLSNNVEALRNVRYTAPATRAEEDVTAPEVIYDTPSGTPKLYSRSGNCFLTFFGYIFPSTQDGVALETVEDGNDIYVKDLVSSAVAQTWVKGTKSGNEVHIPLGQHIIYYESVGYGMTINIGKPAQIEFDGEIYDVYEKTPATEVVFTIDENGVWKIQSDLCSTSEEDPELVLGVFYDDDGSWAGMADWNSTYTSFDGTTLSLPDGVTVSDWVFKAENSAGDVGQRLVKGGELNGKFYIQGLNSDAPDACIEGDVADGKVKFPSDQYIGLTNGYFCYFGGATYSIESVTENGETYDQIVHTPTENLEMTYDAEAGTLKSENPKQVLVLNGGKLSEMINTIETGMLPEFKKFNEVPATPQNPEIVYFNDGFAEWGESELQIYVPLADTEGNFINPAKLSYVIYTRIGGEDEKFTFYSDEYPGLAALDVDELTEIPYGVEVYDPDGYYVIGSEAIYFYTTAPDAYGIQSIYTGGGVRKESDIVWYQVSAVKNITEGSAEVSAIYGLDGIRRSELTPGINIVKMTDGKVRKILVHNK